VLAGKLAARRKACAPLAGKSTLNRLELGGAALTRYHRIAWDGAKIEAWSPRSRPNSQWPNRRASSPKNRRAGSTSSSGRPATAGAASAASWPRPNGRQAPPIRALSSPRSAPRTPAPQPLYEEIYCSRGDMENRIKECQLDLFADRTSAATMRANQLRLWFASMAYMLLCALRRLALLHTQFAKATCGTIRLKLLKIGALVRTSVRRITFAWPPAIPINATSRSPTRN